VELQQDLVELKAARMQEMLNELEAPLHRVERPSTTSHDPLASVMRQRAFDAVTTKKTRPKSRLATNKRQGQSEMDLVAKIILAGLGILSSAVIVMAISRMMRG